MKQKCSHDITEILLKVALNNINQKCSETFKCKVWLHLFMIPEEKIEMWKFKRVSELLLFNTNSAIFQLYHGENMLIFNEMMMKSALY